MESLIEEYKIKNKELENKYLIFLIKNEKYAFSIKNIKEIIRKPNINHVPNLPDYYLGMSKLRDDIVPIISLRKRLKYPSLEEENKALIETLKLREQDHINWLNELEKSIKEDREFQLQRDPKLCNFGRWYYSFKTDSYTLKAHLDKFELPHNQIHSIANLALDTKKNKGVQDALDIIEATRSTTLKSMITLFNELYKILETHTNERTIVFYSMRNKKQLGFIVDRIDRIIEIPKENIEAPEIDNQFSEYLNGIGKVNENFYLIFNENKLS